MQRLSNIQPVDLNNEYFQILFSGSINNGHWIAIWYVNNVIHVYDSLNTFSLNDDHIIFINRLFPNKENLRVTYEEVQQQTNSHDCGVFAIAFVVSIAFGKCPCSVKFDINLMRRHLYLMFENFTLAPFPLLNSSNDYMYDLVPINVESRIITHTKNFIEFSLNFSRVNINQLEELYLNRLITQQQLLMSGSRSTLNRVRGLGINEHSLNLLDNDISIIRDNVAEINSKKIDKVTMDYEQSTDSIVKELKQENLNFSYNMNNMEIEENFDHELKDREIINEFIRKKHQTIKDCYVKIENIDFLTTIFDKNFNLERNQRKALKRPSSNKEECVEAKKKKALNEMIRYNNKSKAERYNFNKKRKKNAALKKKLILNKDCIVDIEEKKKKLNLIKRDVNFMLL